MKPKLNARFEFFEALKFQLKFKVEVEVEVVPLISFFGASLLYTYYSKYCKNEFLNV